MARKKAGNLHKPRKLTDREKMHEAARLIESVFNKLAAETDCALCVQEGILKSVLSLIALANDINYQDEL